ncbi:COG3014 family protein [Trinickia fusca]|uniref:COG3014 family protein n=1 Tax=Trinickia fusca TaxID=2419777 RepID=UPI001600F0B4|nr:hypothetical protein [Trinickia fusca]
MSTTTDIMRTGSIDAAIASHEHLYEGDKPDDRDLLYYFERGELMRTRTSGVDASSESWRVADSRIRGWEDDARGKLSKTAGDVGAWLLSDDFARYEGQDYEKVMLNTMLAENDMIAGKWDQARIEIRKMYERETFIADLRSKQVDALKDEAQKHDVKDSVSQVEDIKGYPVAIFKDPEVNNLRNSYQSAASHYLAGFLFEALNEQSLAAAGYQQAIKLRPDVPMLKDSLANLGKSRPANGKTDLLVIVETGWIPARDSVDLTLPIMIGNSPKLLTASYPVIRPDPSNYAPSSILIGTQQVPTVVATNLDAMARRALRDDMPTLIARSAVRMAVSAAAQTALSSKDNDTGKLLSLAVGVASALTSRADTREWRTLPAYISLARVSVPSGQQTLSIDTPQGRLSATLDIEGTHALAVLRPIGPFLQALASVAPSDTSQAGAASPTLPASPPDTATAAPRKAHTRKVARQHVPSATVAE